jgi:hypothetical protein
MATKTKAPPKTKDDADLCWVSADKDYKIALENGKLVCQNPKGSRLASVPKWLKDGEAAQQLTGLKEWLAQHEGECRETLELWMLRSLPVARTVLVSIWPDPAWSGLLKNLVVCAVKGSEIDQEESGFLRDVDAKKGVGIVDLDGETQWIKSESVALPHPILLADLNDFRELSVELGFDQALDQLFRQTWKPDAEQLEKSSIQEFSGGKFEMLTHVMGLCRRLGYRVKGGSATCPVWENGKLIEARYWIGADSPDYETYTGELLFTDERERSVPIKEVGPVAFSEGMRMASAIYAKRVVKKEDDED